MRQHGHNNLRLVPVTLDEERADRAIDQAGNQCFLFRRASLALEIAAGNTSGCKGLFLIVHGQREEIDSRLGRLCRHNSRENSRLAIGGKHRTVCLACNTPGLEGQLAAGPHQLNFLDIKHTSFLSDMAYP